MVYAVYRVRKVKRPYGEVFHINPKTTVNPVYCPHRIREKSFKLRETPKHGTLWGGGGGSE